MATPTVSDRSLDTLFSSISCSVLGAAGHGPRQRQRQHAPLGGGPVAHYRLYVCLAGSAQVAVDGRPHPLLPGGVVLVPPGAAHAVTQDAAAPLSVFSIDFVARLHGLIDLPAFCGMPVSLMPSATRRPKIADSALSIVNHLTNRIPGYQLALHTHCVRLLDLLWKETLAARSGGGRSASGPGSPGAPAADGAGPAAAGGTPTRSPRDLLRFGPAFRLIEERYAQHVTLNDLAATAHLHPAYFCAVFKRLTGVPPLHYLARYRLERARDLLLATDRSLEEIARLTGFCDAAHLIRVFRRYEGVSPGRYRRAPAA